MFGLSGQDLRQRSILDCCAGGSSFAAETEGPVVALDPAYSVRAPDLRARVEAGLRDGDRIIDDHADRFDWSWYGHPARRTELRRAAAERFLADHRHRPERYVAGALPDLPLGTGRFDLVLCSHLLFTWSDRFDEEWHHRAVIELVRVARREVRIFPLVVQGTGRPVPFLDDLRDRLHAAGHRSHLREVPYRFQHDAHQMLHIDVSSTAQGRRQTAVSTNITRDGPGHSTDLSIG